MACAIAGDRAPTEEEEAIFDSLLTRYGDLFYSNLLFVVTHENFEPDQARELWEEILKHKFVMSCNLNRNVGLSVAAMDYLTNIRRTIDSPTVISKSGLATIAEIALKDGLTRLYDHFTFLHKLHKEVKRADRYNGEVSLVMLDLDNFKKYNDTYGHPRGDEVLEKTGKIILDSIRETDVGGRYGGEEFGIVLPHTSITEATALSERVRELVFEEFSARGVTFSIGVSTFPDPASNGHILLDQADSALYYSKKNGKNKVTMWSKDLEA